MNSSHVWMRELDYKESRVLKNWYFWTVVLEKTLESHLGCKEIQPVHPKGNQSWTFIGRTDVEAETPIFWPPDVKSWLIGKDSDARRDWGQEEKGTTKDEMAGWHHWLDGLESEWTPGVGDEQGGLACCDSWCCKESDTMEQLNWTELDCSTPHFPVLHHLPELDQTHVHWVGYIIQTSCSLSFLCLPTFNLPQHQGLFTWVSYSDPVAKVLGVSALASVLPMNSQDWFPV